MGYSWNEFKSGVSNMGSNIVRATEKGVSDIGNAGQQTIDDVNGTSAQRKSTIIRNKKLEEDAANFKKFKEQDLLNIDNDLYTPQYLSKSSGDLKKEQEAMLSLFNARKDQILSQRATPGIAQTRF
jgi:hypothetical protein